MALASGGGGGAFILRCDFPLLCFCFFNRVVSPIILKGMRLWIRLERERSINRYRIVSGFNMQNYDWAIAFFGKKLEDFIQLFPS